MPKAINKVVYGGNTILDLTDLTVDQDKLLRGYTARRADGNKVTGTVDQTVEYLQVGGTVTLDENDIMEFDDSGGVTPTGTINISTNGIHDVTNYASANVNVSTLPTLQSKTTTPSESQQTITADNGYDGLSSVTVDAVSSSYVGSGITRRSSTDLTASGATVTVPSGFYSSQATKSVSSGSAGTPTASKGTVSNNSVTITPSVTNIGGYISGGTKTGTGVSVNASELVSGTKSITTNGTNIDVTNYASVDVNVASSAKNVQVYSGYSSRTANSYGSTGVTLTVAKTGTYKVTWMAWRGSSSGTMGTNLHRNSTSGTNQQTWTGTYGQCITLNNQSYNKDDVLTLYATSGNNSRTIYVGNLIIEEV